MRLADRIKRRPWMAPVAAALALRVGYIWSMRGHAMFVPTLPGYDMTGFHLWAQKIASGHLALGAPFYQGPLYPYLLGLVYFLAGPSVLAAKLIQALVGTGSVALVWWLGNRLFGRSAGLWAATFAALCLIFPFYEGFLLCDTLVTFLNLALVAALVAYRGDRPLRWAVLCGIILGLDALTRANILVMAPVGAWWIWRKGTEAARKNRVIPAALFLLVTLAVISPATLHNRISGGRWVLVSENFSQNWRVGNSYDSTGGYWNPEKELMPVFSKDFFRLQIKKLGKLLSDYEEPNNVNFYHFRRYNRLLQLPLLSWGFFLAFGLAGMALSWRRRRQLFPLYGYLALYGLSIVAFFVTSRFRLPLYPVMIIFSGHTFAWAAGKLREPQWAKAAAVLVVSSSAWAVLAATSEKTIQAQYFDNMVLLYEKRGDVGGAIGELRAKLKRYPDDAAAALRLAYYLHGEDRSGEALEVMESFLGSHPEEVRILRAAGLLEWELGRRDRAVEYLGRYLAARPHAPDSAEVDSLINLQKGR